MQMNAYRYILYMVLSTQSLSCLAADISQQLSLFSNTLKTFNNALSSYISLPPFSDRITVLKALLDAEVTQSWEGNFEYLTHFQDLLNEYSNLTKDNADAYRHYQYELYKAQLSYYQQVWQDQTIPPTPESLQDALTISNQLQSLPLSPHIDPHEFQTYKQWAKGFSDWIQNTLSAALPEKSPTPTEPLKKPHPIPTSNSSPNTPVISEEMPPFIVAEAILLPAPLELQKKNSMLAGLVQVGTTNTNTPIYNLVAYGPTLTNATPDDFLLSDDGRSLIYPIVKAPYITYDRKDRDILTELGPLGSVILLNNLEIYEKEQQLAKSELNLKDIQKKIMEIPTLNTNNELDDSTLNKFRTAYALIPVLIKNIVDGAHNSITPSAVKHINSIVHYVIPQIESILQNLQKKIGFQQQDLARALSKKLVTKVIEKKELHLAQLQELQQPLHDALNQLKTVDTALSKKLFPPPHILQYYRLLLDKDRKIRKQQEEQKSQEEFQKNAARKASELQKTAAQQEELITIQTLAQKYGLRVEEILKMTAAERATLEDEGWD